MLRSPTLTFARKAIDSCPEPLKPALLPLLRTIDELTREIQLYDKMVETKAKKDYPATSILQTIYGVGPLTALTFVLLLDNNPARFQRSRDLGCYFGLRPKQRDSGMATPQLSITKTGDALLRRLATQCAQHILGPFGKDSALCRWGQSLSLKGGKNAKKRAITAVARKLVVLMHRLWVTGEAYDPMRGLPASPQAA